MKTKDLKNIKVGISVYCTKCANLRQGVITNITKPQPSKGDYTVCAVQWSYLREAYWLTEGELKELYADEALAIIDVIRQLRQVADSANDRIQELKYKIDQLQTKN